MRYALGIDIGASTIAAAIATTTGEGAVEAAPLELGANARSAPAVVSLTDDERVLVGEAAVRHGADHPERVVRDLTRRIGDEVPYVIGGLDVFAEELYALAVEWVVARACDQQGEAPRAVNVAHPRHWGSHRINLLIAALEERGLDDVAFIPEPIAAAMHASTQHRLEPGSMIAVLDLGGGTVDAAVLRVESAETFVPIGAPHRSDAVGGSAFDDEIFDHVARYTDGAVRRPGTPDASGAVSAMTIAGMRRACTDAKEALSTETEAVISVPLADGPRSVRLIRSEFEAMIEPHLRASCALLGRAIAASGVEAAELEAILLFGGSARIPLVAERVSSAFERPVVLEAAPEDATCRGAAIAAAARAMAASGLGEPDGLALTQDAAIDGEGDDADADAGLAPLVHLTSKRGRSRQLGIALVAACAAAVIALVVPSLPVAASFSALVGDDARTLALVAPRSSGPTGTGGATEGAGAVASPAVAVPDGEGSASAAPSTAGPDPGASTTGPPARARPASPLGQSDPAANSGAANPGTASSGAANPGASNPGGTGPGGTGPASGPSAPPGGPSPSPAGPEEPAASTPRDDAAIDPSPAPVPVPQESSGP